MDHLDKAKYELIPIKITKENTWISSQDLASSYQPVIPEQIVSSETAINSVGQIIKSQGIDVVFPVLHGPYGEDGTVQGMLELMRLPYVGCGVLASAVCMDKVVQKQLCQAAGIPIPKYVWLTQREWEVKDFDILNYIQKLRYPLFVKPANQGSSVGITKAHNQTELLSGIKLALTRDLKVIIEQGIPHTREIECGLLGPNHAPATSVLGEIIPGREFYDYRAKYLDDNSLAVIPAKLPKKLSLSIQATAKLAFQVLACFGLARADFLLNGETGEYYLSELNTMPGFTAISMYPKLWEASGLSYPQLLDRLISLALTRQAERSSLNLSR